MAILAAILPLAFVLQLTPSQVAEEKSSKTTHRGTNDAESLSGLPLLGLADPQKANWQMLRYHWAAMRSSIVSNKAFHISVLSKKRHLDHDPRSPVAIVGVRSDSEQALAARGEEDTRDVKKHRVHCGLSGQCSFILTNVDTDSRGRVWPPHSTLPSGYCKLTSLAKGASIATDVLRVWVSCCGIWRDIEVCLRAPLFEKSGRLSS